MKVNELLEKEGIRQREDRLKLCLQHHRGSRLKAHQSRGKEPRQAAHAWQVQASHQELV